MVDRFRPLSSDWQEDNRVLGQNLDFSKRKVDLSLQVITCCTRRLRVARRSELLPSQNENSKPT